MFTDEIKTYCQKNKFEKNINKYIDPKDIKQGKLKPGKTKLSDSLSTGSHKGKTRKTDRKASKSVIYSENMQKTPVRKRIRRQSKLTDREGDDTGPAISHSIYLSGNCRSGDRRCRSGNRRCRSSISWWERQNQIQSEFLVSKNTFDTEEREGRKFLTNMEAS